MSEFWEIICSLEKEIKELRVMMIGKCRELEDKVKEQEIMLRKLYDWNRKLIKGGKK